jgi:hypothetical protein
MIDPTVARAEDEHATCRGCGRELIGKPYYMGGDAYIPGPQMKRAKVNHYGGFVCSYECDFRASLELEQSMPGHGCTQKTLGEDAKKSLASNWPPS